MGGAGWVVAGIGSPCLASANTTIEYTCYNFDIVACKHLIVACLNHYELIRKYRCIDCGEVMMCNCDKPVGLEFLPHQLEFGTELESQKRIPVTLGFQPNICEECRGEPITAHPKAEIYGATSKIKRYYWREIIFEEYRLLSEWAKDKGISVSISTRHERPEEFGAIQKQALTNIKRLHKINPKYEYSDISQQEIIDEYEVALEDVHVLYVSEGLESKRIKAYGGLLTPEEFGIRYYEERGFAALHTESTPFHVLFGVFLYSLIQDSRDARNSRIHFGRMMEPNDGGKESVWTLKPDDFGSKGYFARRRAEIEEHFSLLPKTKDGLIELFDISLQKSADLRQYLWAFRVEDVAKARLSIEILPVDKTILILRYLITNYWARYLGWPDLLISDSGEYSFVEVKASKDKLSLDQKNWIKGNAEYLDLPFKILKLHRRT